MKKIILRLISLFAAILSLPCLYGCEEQKAPVSSTEDIYFKYQDRILELESKLIELRNDQFESELEYLDQIKLLRSEIDEMREFIYSSADTVPPSTEANKNESNGFTYTEYGGEITITGYNGTKQDLVIPGSINGLPVTAIGEGAFRAANITSVTLPDTVKKIDWFAFADCAKLSRIAIPSSVDEIGYDAFGGCKSLVIYTSNGSFAEKYAKSYGITVSAE